MARRRGDPHCHRSDCQCRRGRRAFCTAGQDWTGIIAALLLAAAGVSRETILAVSRRLRSSSPTIRWRQ
ncbi:tyrosine-protein phosphatase [Rhizobium leguminosarum]|uniref:tyrosine-protein phosphatase n=1 Tax=Rhizobium leguminosarum TaxID=384 RepID=UPI001C907B40|nr:hypothetical protein [Rhizobium leguminosarum]